MGWGQQLDALVHATGVTRAALDAGVRSTTLAVQVFGPARNERATSFMSGTDMASSAAILGRRTSVASSSGVVGLDLLRKGPDTAFQSGTYVVAVSLGPSATSDDLPALPIPFVLHLGHTAEELPSPVFVGRERTEEPSATANPTEEAEAFADSDESAAEAEGGVIRGPLMALVVGAAAAIVLLGMLILLVVRRRPGT